MGGAVERFHRDIRGAISLFVEANWEFGRAQIDRATLLQVIAWRDGELRISRKGGQIPLSVRRVVEGRMEDEKFLQRPMGVANFPVLVLDEAAAGLDSHPQTSASGWWRLRRWPNGAYAVVELDDTPFDPKLGQEELAATGKMALDFQSENPQTRYEAPRAFSRRRCFVHVPEVLAVLDSDAKINSWRLRNY